MKLLTPENIAATMTAAMYPEGTEDTSGAFVVNGFLTRMGFNPETYPATRQDTIDYLLQLTEDIFEFFTAPVAAYNKDKQRWAGPADVEDLYSLAVLHGFVKLGPHGLYIDKSLLQPSPETTAEKA